MCLLSSEDRVCSLLDSPPVTLRAGPSGGTIGAVSSYILLVACILVRRGKMCRTAVRTHLFLSTTVTKDRNAAAAETREAAAQLASETSLV